VICAVLGDSEHTGEVENVRLCASAIAGLEFDVPLCERHRRLLGVKSREDFSREAIVDVKTITVVPSSSGDA